MSAAEARKVAEDYDDLYRKHQGRIRSLCRLLLGGSDDADEVVQQVFLKLFLQQREETREIEWAGWLTRVAVNQCRDQRRSRWWRWSRKFDAEISPEGLPTMAATPEMEAIGAQEQARIWRAFSRLPNRQREVFVMRQLEGWSTEAVAQALGISDGSVKQHLFRAVHSLRRHIGGES